MSRLCAGLILLVTSALAAVATEAQPRDFFDTFERAFPHLYFERPVAIKADPSGNGWMFVVEQNGVIRTFEGVDSAQQSFVVLDITERVVGVDVDVESGLLGIALHPEFDENGYFYVYYITDITGAWTTRVSRFTATGTPAVADPDSELILIEHGRGDLKHNGGDLHFDDGGYLFVSFGDGYCCGDPAQNGQDRTNLFSTIIRIDVDDQTDGLPYGIPQDNPFVGNTEGWREEIWAYGLRNPWRFSIHPDTGELWVGDVGSLTFEEINRIIPGGNYGWSIMEGPECFEWPPGSGQGTDCDPEGLILPVYAYGRDVGISVTGGIFYRGQHREDLVGNYIFADWAFARIFSATLDESGEAFESVEILFDGDWPLPPAFGEDANQELLFLGYWGGVAYRFVEQKVSTPPDPEPAASARLSLIGTNPFRTNTRISVTLGEPAEIDVQVFDILGRHVSALLEDAQFAAGESVLTLERGDLAPGVYVVRLVVNGAVADALRVTVVR